MIESQKWVTVFYCHDQTAGYDVWVLHQVINLQIGSESSLVVESGPSSSFNVGLSTGFNYFSFLIIGFCN